MKQNFKIKNFKKFLQAHSKYTLNKVSHTKYHKKKINIIDKLTYLYKIDFKASLYTYKIFAIIEIQVNSVLLRLKIIPYLFIVPYLCFYYLIQVNSKFITNPFFILTLFDFVQVPLVLYKRLNFYVTSAGQYQSLLTNKFLRKYWQNYINFQIPYVWLLNNCLHSSVCASVLIYTYPQISLYMAPFRRFTQLYLYNSPAILTSRSNKKYLHNAYGVLKLKLFEYVSFYLK